MPSLSRKAFVELVDHARRDARAACTIAVPVGVRLLGDQLTPVLAYRRLVRRDERTAPSFLLESVEGGERQGRHSILASRPLIDVTAFGKITTVHDRRTQGGPQTRRERDPVDLVREISGNIELIVPAGAVEAKLLPSCVLGGWFGYASYDAVRYVEPDKLNTRDAPPDDRRLADVAFSFYDGLVVFDHVDKVVHVLQLALVGAEEEGEQAVGDAYDRCIAQLEERVADLRTPHDTGEPGRLGPPSEPAPMSSNVSEPKWRSMIERALEYIRAGDIFQVVLGQRFERTSAADPFDVYRALRAVNPSPYMVYMQSAGAIIVSGSPEILCRVRRQTHAEDAPGRLVVTNRPLAGTRPRGRTPGQDIDLERELLGDPKERAEHVMLVDLGRNDVGKVAIPGTVSLDAVMEVERYSHVMHISSTVTGVLRRGLDCWDALRAALPVGTISGAPKVRAMQIIDELEPVRRGPYGGGIGWVGLDGQMDIALALRTIVVPTDLHQPAAPGRPGSWTYHIQAAAGIVADSVIESEHRETVSKAAGMARAIDVAESAFG
ncbi:MAG: chorismate-binding protein [Planctomycetota bacterium]